MGSPPPWMVAPNKQTSEDALYGTSVRIELSEIFVQRVRKGHFS